MKKDFSRQFYPQNYDFAIFVPKFTHDWHWQVNSICCKSCPYEQEKEFNGFQFHYFRFKPEKKKKKKKLLGVFKLFQYISIVENLNPISRTVVELSQLKLTCKNSSMVDYMISTAHNFGIFVSLTVHDSIV